MATFEDNAVVTAEDLNNIAVDLGDTTFSAFSEEKFGVDKLNEITADLVGKGILTTGDRCEAIISDGKVYIKSGVIVFGSGAKIRISEPVGVDLVNGSYIYAFNDVTTGKASIEVSESLPTAGDYVALAQLDSTGDAVTDLREMAVAKITLPAELQNNYAEQTVKISVSNRSEIAVAPALPQCKYMKMIASANFEEEAVNSYYSGAKFFFVELSEEYQYLFNYQQLNYSPKISVKKVDGTLYFTGWSSSSDNYYGDTITFILM